MAGFVWSLISSLLGNALLHDDALNTVFVKLGDWTSSKIIRVL